MATSQLPQLGANADFNQVKSTMIQWQDYLNWFFRNLDSLNIKHLTADRVDTGILNTNLVTITASDGSYSYTIGPDGIVANNGSVDTLQFDLATGLLTIVSMLIKSTNSNEKIAIDSSGFHSYDASGVERITIGTTPAEGAKALIGRDTSGAAQSVYTYDTATVDGASRTGQFITAHGTYFVLASDGSIRMQDSTGNRGLRIAGSRPELNDGFGWSTIAKKSEVDAKANAFTGYTGSFSTGTQTVTVSNGIITSVV